MIMNTNILKRTKACCNALVLGTLLSILPATAWSAQAIINPSQDNTLAQELPDNSSGACDSIFSGLTDNGVGTARRALLQFDIAGNIPPGSTINSVSLSLTVTRGSNHIDSMYTLHRVTTAWGEGANGCGVRGGGQGESALAGSATWLSALHNLSPAWSSPGGDYGAASGDTLVNTTTPVWDSTAAMISDVQNWLDNPATNYGWALIGDESTKTTARRFASREGVSQPALVVDFTPFGPVEACCEPPKFGSPLRIARHI